MCTPRFEAVSGATTRVYAVSTKLMMMSA